MATTLTPRPRTTIQNRYEAFVGEGLKDAAEVALAGLSRYAWGEKLIEAYAFGAQGRVQSPALNTTVAGIEFENPVLVGAGWTKKAIAINGLYRLGFGGVEYGTVPLMGQPGNQQPRIWTIDRHHSVGLNRLGFNSPGSEVVAHNLESLGELLCPVGANVGLNKDMPHEHAPWAHAAVIQRLYPYADYFALGISSPNTKDLRTLQRKENLRAIIVAAQEAMESCGGQKPLFVKIAPDLTYEEIDDIVGVISELGIAGIIAVNTTISPEIKAKYGPRWSKEAGGLSGNDWEYAFMSAVIIRYIYELYERAGDKLDIIAAGGIKNAEGALERMMAGASAIQVVTAIRPSWGMAAAQINKDLLDWMKRHRVENIQEIIGVATTRGAKYPELQQPIESRSSFLRIASGNRQKN